MLKNGYIDTAVQKGFIERVAGCIEHSETVFQAIVDARTHTNGTSVLAGLISPTHMAAYAIQ